MLKYELAGCGGRGGRGGGGVYFTIQPTLINITRFVLIVMRLEGLQTTWGC